MAMARSGTDLGAAAHFDREGLSGLAGQAVAKLAEVVRVRGLLRARGVLLKMKTLSLSLSRFPNLPPPLSRL